MREIKFRAWVTDGNSYSEMYPNVQNHIGSDFGFGHMLQNTVKGLDCKVMQYTGLKDKNGVEIYEGDIVTGEYHNLCVDYSKVGEVKFGYTYDSDGYANESTLGWISSNESSLADLEECEVIGNIYENPDLLEDK